MPREIVVSFDAGNRRIRATPSAATRGVLVFKNDADRDEFAKRNDLVVKERVPEPDEVTFKDTQGNTIPKEDVTARIGVCYWVKSSLVCW
jgi:hypothetical protein